jgi:hypothetical protein
MSLLRVDTADLQMLAGHCESWADEVGAQPAINVVGQPFQATAAAVCEMYAAAGDISKALDDVLRSTARNLHAAASSYASSDSALGVLIARPDQILMRPSQHLDRFGISGVTSDPTVVVARGCGPIREKIAYPATD